MISSSLHPLPVNHPPKGFPPLHAQPMGHLSVLVAFKQQFFHYPYNKPCVAVHPHFPPNHAQHNARTLFLSVRRTAMHGVQSDPGALYPGGSPQKSSSVVKRYSLALPPGLLTLLITPARWYSPTRRSKKFALPSSEIISIQSNGLRTLYSVSYLHKRPQGEGSDRG